MENEVKKIFLTYKVISEIKQSHNSLINEASWSEVRSGIVSGLEDQFEKMVNEFKNQLSKLGCYSTFTSGTDTTRKNPKSLHKKGLAVDVRTYDHAAKPVPPFLSKDCLDRALKICGTIGQKYPGFKCVHEKNASQSSGDFTAPHLHIEYSSGKSSPTDSFDITGGGRSYNRDEYTTSMLSGALGKLVGPVAKQIVTPMARKFGLAESFDFGANSEIKSKYEIVIKGKSGKIKSPISGKIERNYSFTCKNEILVISENEEFTIKFCGITHPSYLSEKILKGGVLGTSDEDVTVYLLSRSSSKIDWNSETADELINPKKTYNRKTNKKYREELIPALIDLAVSPFKNKKGEIEFVSPTSGKLPEPWKGITEEQEKINKDLQRIKKLLK